MIWPAMDRMARPSSTPEPVSPRAAMSVGGNSTRPAIPRASSDSSSACSDEADAGGAEADSCTVPAWASANFS